MCSAFVRPHQSVHRHLALNHLVGSVPESLYTLSELKSLYAPTDIRRCAVPLCARWCAYAYMRFCSTQEFGPELSDRHGLERAWWAFETHWDVRQPRYLRRRRSAEDTCIKNMCAGRMRWLPRAHHAVVCQMCTCAWLSIGRRHLRWCRWMYGNKLRGTLPRAVANLTQLSLL